jgi:O-antigen/teichoic acid export membrane protein/peptidoglycan/xylan/chitin deacetylase (PgdA/CDA1 family)
MANTNSAKKTIGISFATQYVELGIHFLGVLALARILSPDDIGTYSVAAFLMTLLHMFRDFGVVQYIIQEHDLTAEKIRSAMGVTIILALTVALVLLGGSGLIARFYDNPAIEKILQVMSLSFAISPFGSLLFAIFRRELRLHTIFWIKIVSALCHVTTALTLATHGFGAISLAWANFAGILSFGFVANLMRPKEVPWMPRFKNIKTILSFGSVASVGNAANIAGTNIPDLVIGKVLNMAAVGYFSRATGLVQLFTRLITGALLPLVLPYFAQLRREGKDLAIPYLAAVEQLTALAWPFFAVMMLLAYPLVRALYGTQWDASVPIVELLCLAGAISSLSLFATQVMVANGQVGNSTYSHLLAQPFRIAAVIFAATYGLMTIASVLIASEFLTLAIVSWFLHKTIKVGVVGLILACKKSAFVALCTSIVPLIVKIFWVDNPAHPWPPLLVGMAGATVGWVISMLLTRHQLAEHLISMIPSIPNVPGTEGNSIRRRDNIKYLIKILAYRSGLLAAYHRFRNRKHLTVAMFHRVLPPSDSRYAGADPEWTMTPDSFANCLAFFRKHYHIVTPDQVFSALRGESQLPNRSLLITFDDGWADTAEFANPILEKFSMPALIFIAGCTINQKSAFWEERVFSFLKTHPEGITQLIAILEQNSIPIPATMPSVINEQNIRLIIKQLGEIDRPTIDAILTELESDEKSKPAMLNAEQLAQLVASFHTIGGHGMIHKPLTKVHNLEAELKNAQGALTSCLNIEPIESMSFPHGAYSDAVIAQCRAVGYRYLFSSDAHLNMIEKKSDAGCPVGRIHISERAIINGNGNVEPTLLATSLFLRPFSRVGKGV